MSKQSFCNALIRRISIFFHNQHPDKTVCPRENDSPKAFSFAVSIYRGAIAVKTVRVNDNDVFLVKERKRRVEYLSRNLAFLDDDGGNPRKRGMSRNDVLSPFCRR